MSSIQFSGPDNFSTLLFGGSDTLGIDCTRDVTITLAQAEFTEFRSSDQSKLKSSLFDKGLMAERMPKP